MSVPSPLRRLSRGAIAGTVSVLMTGGSLAVVSWMNQDPAAERDDDESLGPRTVPLAPPPPPPAPSDAALDPAPMMNRALAAPAEPLAAPSPAPPQIAGLAPTAGPGTMALGAAGGSLPSMGTLPGAELPTTTTAGQETAARPKSRPRPTYPRLAQRQGVEGFVTLRLRIGADGRVDEAVVVKAEPPGVFDEAALRAARRYRFTPARRGDEAVASTLQQTIRFELQQ
ncbi:MAG: energy transducer TonB [Nannocystaceae bacterium]|nr:energy transducer TonB [bacterium]